MGQADQLRGVAHVEPQPAREPQHGSPRRGARPLPLGLSDRGLPGFVNLIGIDSPGLTSAPAIADYVAGLVG